MLFRPYPVLTLVSVPILAALIALGVWQLNRADWKADLITRWEASAKARPGSLGAAICGRTADDAAPRLVAAEDVLSRRLDDRFIRMFGHNSAGGAGWRLFAAISAPDCGSGALLAEVGFEPLPSEIDAPREAPPPTAYIVSPWPRANAFAPANDPAGNDWHQFDGRQIAEALDQPKLDQTQMLEPFSDALPEVLARTPPSRHIGYAVTWFGMAAGFVLIYAAFHARAGRLRFSSGDRGPQ